MAVLRLRLTSLYPYLSVLTRSITILAAVMKWGWIRALKTTTARDILHGIYKRALTKQSGEIGAWARELLYEMDGDGCWNFEKNH